MYCYKLESLSEQLCWSRPRKSDWRSLGSRSVIDTDKVVWLTPCCDCLTDISVSCCADEIIWEQRSHFSWDFQTKTLNTSISNVQEICICFYTLETHWSPINTDGLEPVQFPKSSTEHNGFTHYLITVICNAVSLTPPLSQVTALNG